MRRLIVGLIDSPNPQALHQALHWLYGFVRPHRLAIAGLLGLSVCASLLVLVQPWLTKQLIDDGLLARNFPVLATVAGLMIVAGLLGTALSGVNRYLHTRLSGRILFALRGPKSLAICTLLDKPSRREVDVPVEYVGFAIPDEFVVGFGIDYAQRYRHLPYIGKVVMLDE